ncbi:MAG: VCBS repeat-containing protein [Myxococcales bacterium]|nr:VCBS repeat-containing protein [Myxococcales bacterium]
MTLQRVRASLVLSSAIGLTVSGAACGSAETEPAADPRPPRVCKSQVAAPLPWFVEVTDEVGLGATPALLPAATSVVSADLDADGYADLLAFRGDSHRGLIDGKRVRFLFMNRPDPGDPSGTKRVFVDVPDQAGLLATRDGAGERGASIALLGDLDGDGSVDVLTCPSDFTTNAELQDPCVAFLNDGTAHFALAPPSELDLATFPATSAALLDADLDGVLDFWPASMSHWGYGPPGSQWHLGPRIFRGAGDGTFTNATALFGLDFPEGGFKTPERWRPTFGVTTCDLDDDGDMDVVTASYGRQDNQVWRLDGGTYVNVAGALGLDHDDRMDYSDDESYRCYCAATLGCTPMPPAPQLACNQFGNPYLRGWSPGITDQPWSLGGNNFGVACVDADDDGDMDVMFATVTHGDVGSSSDPTELALNPGDGGKFVRPGNDATGLARPPLGLYDNFGDNEPVFADVDLDGRKDLYLTSTVYPGVHPWFWRQLPDGTFEEITEAAGLVDATHHPITQGVDFVDLDGDGDLDLVTGSVEGDSAIHAYRNLVGQSSNYLRVRLVGLGAGHSNRSAIGARVRVSAGGRTQTLEVKGGAGIGHIQNDFVLTFGLGEACDVDALEVRWPDAAHSVTTFADVRANYTVTVREGDSTLEYR